MKYYRIEESTDLKIIGAYPQAQKANHLVPVDNPLHLWKARKIGMKWDNSISIPEPILTKKAKLTDLISSVATGGNLIISNKLKEILEKVDNNCIQFMRVNVIYNENKTPYWLVNPFCFGFENVDFTNSEIWLETHGNTKISKVFINSIDEFEQVKTKHKLPERISIEKIELKKEIKNNFFILRHIATGSGYFISEKLKNEIEQAGCTGIRFMGINEPL
jgi:hypothetical protein